METIEFIFKSFWHFIGSITILYFILYFTTNGIIRFWSRLTRMIMVIFRGWPPQHLDADGDFNNKIDEEIGEIDKL